MTRSTTRLASLAVLLTLAVSPALAIDLGGHDRDGTVVGLTMGYGWNSIDFNGADGSPFKMNDIETFSGGFRVGWASNDHLIMSLGMYGWKRDYYSAYYLSTSATQYHFMLEAYWFPLGEGFWIKGGIGRGTLDFYGQAIDPRNNLVFNEKGWTLGTGVGYEFRVSDGAAIGFCWDYFHLPVGDYGALTDIKTDSNAISLNLHFYMN